MFDGVWQEQGLWCVERSNEQWTVPAFQASNLEIPNHLQHAVEIPYGVFNGYEVFQLGQGFVAYPTASPYWFQNQIVGSSIEEVLVMLDAIERIDKVGAPWIVESRDGFNIVSYRGKNWIADQAAGAIDFRNQELLNRLVAIGVLFEVETIGAAKETIDRMVKVKEHIAETKD
jgi:hypothetical protein